MYNRYVPQPDGSYKRKTVPERIVPQAPKAVKPIETPQKEELPQSYQAQNSAPIVPERTKRRESCKSRPSQRIPEKSAGSFLKDLLPKDLDTGDLLVILLLLLISSDGSDDQGSALLTLALYLFM